MRLAKITGAKEGTPASGPAWSSRSLIDYISGKPRRSRGGSFQSMLQPGLAARRRRAFEPNLKTARIC
jgi:hypothetical protein